MDSIAIAIAALEAAQRSASSSPGIVDLREKLFAAFEDCALCGGIIVGPTDEELAAWLRGDPGACDDWAFHMDPAWREGV
jgi:hypothetical protein